VASLAQRPAAAAQGPCRRLLPGCGRRAQGRRAAGSRGASAAGGGRDPRATGALARQQPPGKITGGGAARGGHGDRGRRNAAPRDGRRLGHEEVGGRAGRRAARSRGEGRPAGGARPGLGGRRQVCSGPPAACAGPA
ncbi:unnamed protein product, partial [Prorocentrum cordatum]